MVGGSDTDKDGVTNYQEWKIVKNPIKRDIKSFNFYLYIQKLAALGSFIS